MIDAPKIHTDLLWDLSFLFIVLIVAYFASVFFFRNKISASSKKVAARKKELSPMISEFLFHEDDDPKNEKQDYINLKIKIRHLLQDKFNRRVLSEILLDLRKDVTGDTQRRLFDLYKNLELHKDAYQKLKSWQWHIVSKGILELTQMHVEESYNLITKFINDKRVTIRKQAEIAAVSLKPEGISYFLDTTRYRISEWQQLKLLDVMRNIDDFQPPRFKAWLTSSNRHVVLFALRLIKFYNQNDVNTSLVELTKHKNNQIKGEAIRCIKDFNVVEALETLETVFWKSTVDIKISILDAIAAIGSEKNIAFLKLIEDKEANFTVRSKALSAINTIVPESILPTDGIQDISNYQIPNDLAPKEKDKDTFASDNFQLELEVETETENKSLEDTEKEESTAKINYETEDKVEEGEPLEVEEPADRPNFEGVNDLSVSFEEIPTDLSESKNDDDEIEPYSSAIEEGTGLLDVDLHFLPIVIDQEVESFEENIQDDKESTTVSGNDISLNDIDVCYEEVIPEDSEMIESVEETGFEPFKEFMIHELDFLPIVVDAADIQDVPAKAPNRERYRYSIDKASQNADRTPEKIKLVFEEVVLPERSEEIAFELTKGEPGIPTSTYNIDLGAVSQIEVRFEEVIVEKGSAKDKFSGNGAGPLDSEIFIRDVPPYEEAFFDEGKDSLKNLQKFIPEIELYEQETLDMMELLDDIEELGDEREIPLLLEYLEEADVPVVRERIEEILKKFSYLEIRQLAKSKSDQSQDSFAGHSSVVQDFFEHCDSESKLILMDTLTDLLDAKEANFVKGLLNDPDQRIVAKARILLENWEKEYSDNEETPSEGNRFNETLDEVNAGAEDSVTNKETSEEYDFLLDKLEIRKSKGNDILQIDFQIDSLEDETEQELTEEEIKNESSFMTCLWSIPNKIFDRLNG